MESRLKKGLGRGLSSLLGDSQKKEETNKVLIRDIIRNKFQPRTSFIKEDLEELTNSIKERGTVSPKGFIGNAMDTANAQGIFDGIGRATGLDVDAMVGQGELDATITIIATE